MCTDIMYQTYKRMKHYNKEYREGFPREFLRHVRFYFRVARFTHCLQHPEVDNILYTLMDFLNIIILHFEASL